MKYKKYLIFVVVSVVLSIFTQLLLGDADYNKITNSRINVEIVNSSGYEIVDNTYTVIDNDPQLYLNFIGSTELVKVEFSEYLQNDMNMQIFYAVDGGYFSEENSIRIYAKKNQKDIYIKLPFAEYDGLRLDIGNEPGQKFEFEGIDVYSGKISIISKLHSIIGTIDIYTTVMLILLFMIILFLVDKYKHDEHKLKTMFVLGSFLLFLIYSLVQPFDSCPDEWMRYDLIKYLYEYNRMPHGGDPVIRNPVWGFSYGFTPYLSGMLSAGFMKVMSLITTDSTALIFAARFVAVLAGTISVFFIIKIADEVFENKIYRWFFIITISCLPQYIFLGSYMNNDMMSLLSVAIIIYCWIKGIKSSWNYKILILFAVGMSVCILSYYNAYGYVLMSVFLFIFTSINLKTDKKEIIQKFIIVFVLTFILSGWFFIRNAILYNGDFLGMQSITEYGEMYASDSLKPSMRTTPYNTGVSLWYMLFDMQWLNLTYQSLIGRFGYMTIRISTWMYSYYFILFTIGVLLYIVIMLHKLFNSKRSKNHKLDKNKMVFEICLFVGGFICIPLSIYQSYFSGFQPQGRYIMSFLFPLAYFTVKGYKLLFDNIKTKRFDFSKICFAFMFINFVILILSTKININSYI